jgi:hypothetical protein
MKQLSLCKDVCTRIRIKNSIKAICKRYPYDFLSAEIMLEEFIDHLPLETVEATWFAIRYEYKIMDEDIRDAIIAMQAPPLNGLVDFDND